MHDKWEQAGGYVGRTLDAKTLVTLALIGSATWLAYERVLDPAAWALMCSTVGGLWGLAAAAGAPGVRDVVSKLTRDRNDRPA